MSPAIDSAFPGIVTTLGGRQSARTLHFFVSAILVLFVAVHLTMIVLAGFKSRVRAMISGRIAAHEVQAGVSPESNIAGQERTVVRQERA